MNSIVLIRTKLNPPWSGSDLVERPRLMEKLSQGLDRKLILVAAPAGYGKSTLVAEWLAACGRPGAWLSLEEGDSDLVVFLNYFIAAVQTISPGIGEETSALLQAPELPPQQVLISTLINELDQIDAPFVLTVDDYHLIHDMAVHNLMDALLHHAPQVLSLVLISRTNPPLNLNRLRARGQMVEIRAQDLRFTQAETSAFVEKVTGVSVDDATVTLLQEKTEGWPVGLRLSMLALQRPEDLGQLSSRLPGMQLATEYLFQEAFENQPQPIQDCLLKTSILDRFSASLCDAVCDDGSESGQMRGRDFLAWLVQTALFIISLDDQRQWFRYHHLFQRLLKHQLERSFDADAIARLHRRASAWFVQNGLIDEAIHHALAAGDVVGAAEIVEENRRAILNADQWYVLDRWLSKLPEEIKRRRPALLLAQAWVAYFTFQLWKIPPLLESIESLLDEESMEESLRGEIDFFWGHHWFWMGRTAQSLEFLQRALERVPVTHDQVRGEIEVFWAMAGQLTGRNQQVLQALKDWLYHEETLYSVRSGRLLGGFIFVFSLSGELSAAEEAARQLGYVAAKSGNIFIKTWLFYVHGFIHYFRNELEKAAEFFELVVKGRYFLYTRAVVDAMAGLAFTYQALGRPDKATATVEMFLELARKTSDPIYGAIARSCQAHLALLQDDLQTAERWLRINDQTPGLDVMLFWLEIPRVTECRTLIARGTADRLREAENRLNDFLQEDEMPYNIRQSIELLLLKAVAHYKQVRMDLSPSVNSAQGQALLEQAVRLAAPDGWMRPFLELEATIAGPLHELAQRGVAPKFIERILATFTLSQPVVPEVNQARLPEPLTVRELEVLALLARRFSNKEIAAQLHLSPTTVKRHASNIYQKLHVHGRRQAVEKAIALGILPSVTADR